VPELALLHLQEYEIEIFLSCERRFLEVPVPSTPFPPPQNEGSKEMLGQILKFIRRHPLASMGMKVYDHSGPLDFQTI